MDRKNGKSVDDIAAGLRTIAFDPRLAGGNCVLIAIVYMDTIFVYKSMSIYFAR